MNYELNRPLPKRIIIIIKKIGLMKSELGGKTMIKCVGLRGKTYGYFIDYVSEDKQEKVQNVS